MWACSVGLRVPDMWACSVGLRVLVLITARWVGCWVGLRVLVSATKRQTQRGPCVQGVSGECARATLF